MAGMLRRTLPSQGIVNLMRLSPPPLGWTGVIQALESYRRTGTPHLLRQGMLELLRVCPPPEVHEAVQFWDCPYCGRPAPVGVRNCGHCHSASSPGLSAHEFLA